MDSIIFRYTQDYCLDHVIDYCEDCACDPSCMRSHTKNPEGLPHSSSDSSYSPKALIKDRTIVGGGNEKEFNMFGSHSESMTSKVIKMLGYPVSVIFLILSFVLINKYDHQKYWVGYTEHYLIC